MACWALKEGLEEEFRDKNIYDAEYTPYAGSPPSSETKESVRIRRHLFLEKIILLQRYQSPVALPSDR